MDKKITDKGWAAMHELLDREMPEKRRRRFGWWWLGLLLLPIVGYGSWQWLGGTEVPAPIKEAVPAKPFANNDSVLDHSGNIVVENQGTGSSDPASLSMNKNVATEPAKIRERKQFANLNYTPIGVDGTKLYEAEPLAAIISTEYLENKTSLAIDYLQKTEPGTVISDQIKKISPHCFPISGIVKPVKKHAKNHWAFGATTAISTEQFNSINGFSTGVNIDWKFARKWGLRTGVMYNIHTPQEKYRPVASVLSTDYTSNVYGYVIIVDLVTGQEINTGPGANFYGDSLAGNVFIPVNRLQRLEVPVTVFWQAARPLKIIGGLSLTRTLTAKAATQNYSGDYVLKLADQTAEDGASKLSSTELDNWSADATIGAGMQLGKSFEIGFSAKMPLNKFPGIAKNNQHNSNGAFAVPSLKSTRKQNGPVFSLYGTLYF